MSVLHVINNPGPGGLENLVKELAIDQISRGRPTQVYIYDRCDKKDVLFGPHGIDVIPVDSKQQGYDIRTLTRLLQIAGSCDIVHCHDLGPLMRCGPMRMIRRFSGWRNGPRVVHTGHGLTHLDHGSRYRYYEYMGLQMVDRVVAVSSEVHAHYETDLRLKQPKLRQINNGVRVDPDLKQVDPRQRERVRRRLNIEHDVPEDVPLWISAARITPVKNQLVLIRALRRFDKAHLLLVGDETDQAYYAKLRSLDGGKRVHFLGHREDVCQFFLAGDLYVSASLREGTPLSVLEAMSAGLPCALSDIPAHRAIAVCDGIELASFFPPDDDAMLERTVRDLLADRASMSNRVTRAHQNVYKKYSLADMLAKYAALYEELA